MTIWHLAGAAIAVGLLAYLGYALFRPERLE
jgi:K+-transporting ATPase KdpF subunit